MTIAEQYLKLAYRIADRPNGPVLSEEEEEDICLKLDSLWKQLSEAERDEVNSKIASWG